MSSNLLRLCDFDNGTAGLIGIDDDYKSLKLNQLIIASIYTCWDKEIVLLV